MSFGDEAHDLPESTRVVALFPRAHGPRLVHAAAHAGPLERLLHAPVSSDRTLRALQDHLFAIEDAMSRNDGAELARLVGLGVAIPDAIARALRIVQRLIGRIERGRPHAMHATCLAMVRLAELDSRFDALEAGPTLALVERAAAARRKPGNVGRGSIGARAVLASLAAEVGAFDVKSRDRAIALIKAAVRRAR